MRRLARAGALAAIIGGLAWVVKAAAILVTGDQPPVVFALGPPLFAVALIGLHARLEGRGGRLASAGRELAYLAIAASFVLLLARAFAADLLPAGEDDFTPLSPVIAATGLSTLAGLILLGLATRRTEVMPPGWRSLPLAMGVLIVPGMMVAGIVSELSERLLEIPLVLFGLGWVLLGFAIWPPGDDERADESLHQAREAAPEAGRGSDPSGGRSRRPPPAFEQQRE